ncbi:sensor domain-containing diguanylate cyclase [Burkholderia cepacia]|uniref:sensor domain-containing diguanylate cyclase n=1 Tax=Burkholderia cepacia TaxID=292 RepID=UPI00158CFBB1|nr:sensor domain-containing diguanylate cyclase [Burkholderia cepacia]
MQRFARVVRRGTRLPGPLALIPAVTVLVLAVLWLTVLYRLQVDKRSAVHDARESAAVLADALAIHTLKTVHDVDEIARLIQFGYERAPAQFDLKPYQTYGLLSSSTALQVTLVGANGHVLMSTRLLHGDVDLSDREHIAVHRRRADVGLFISRPVIGRISGQRSIQGTRRINRPDGSFGGVVVISEDPAWWTDDFYNSAALGDHGLVAVLSQDGFPLSRRSGDMRGPASDKPLRSYVKLVGTSEHQQVDSFDHVERIVAVRRLNPYGLIVVAGVSVAEALASYVEMRDVYLAMSTVMSFMLIGFAVWVRNLVAQLIHGREALRQVSETDALTGLPNRGKIIDLLNTATSRDGAAGTTVLMFIDLDSFKQLNDTHGHRAGDQLLVEVAARLRTVVGTHGVVGRLGGDEFVALIQGPDAIVNAHEIACAIAVSLECDLPVHGGSYSVRASVGIAGLEIGDSVCDLLGRADDAMYEAKLRQKANKVVANKDKAADDWQSELVR